MRVMATTLPSSPAVCQVVLHLARDDGIVVVEVM